ncbi:MAG: flagellar hook-associated protein FlgL [Oceanospirillaceae bacterium]|nr:flagellar hook-associated protein FlgL [Oceanospirillaceae bacterium]
MRISTTQIYAEANRNMMEGQTKLAEIQNKISSGKNFTTLADDPVGANQVVNLKRELAQFEVFQTNINSTRRRLELEESTIDSLNIAVTRAQELLLQVKNGTLTDADRNSISYELEELVGYAASLMNTRDAKGEYIFSGSKGTTQTYQLNGDGSYTYQGDDTSKQIQVGSSQYLESTDTGRYLFESIPSVLELTTLGGGDNPLLAGALSEVNVLDQDAFDNFMRTTGDLKLSVARIDDGGVTDGLVYSVLDSTGNPVRAADGTPLENISYTDLDTSPNTLEVAVDGATLTMLLPNNAALKDEPNFIQSPEGTAVVNSINVMDIERMQEQFAAFDSLTLVVSGGSYELRDGGDAVVNDINGALVSGSFTAGDTIEAVFDGWTYSFSPDASVSNLTLALDPATVLPGLRVIGGEDTLISDVRIASADSVTESFSTAMLGDGTNPGLGDLKLDIVYDEVAGYQWSLNDGQGNPLGAGGYQDPSIGALTASEDINLSAVTDLVTPIEGSFSLELNGQESGSITLAGPYTDADALVGDIQSQIDLDSVLGGEITVSYTAGEGLMFTSVNDTDEIQFASVDQSIADNLGISSNQVTITNINGVEIDLTLPLDQQSEEITLAYVPPAEVTLRLKQDKTNLLNSMQDAVEAIRTLSSTDAEERLELSDVLTATLEGLSVVQERFSQSVAGMGARLNAMESAEFSNLDFKLLTEGTLSAVEDLDYAAAATELSKRQLALEAAYASFAKIQGLSLFNYIN